MFTMVFQLRKETVIKKIRKYIKENSRFVAVSAALVFILSLLILFIPFILIFDNIAYPFENNRTLFADVYLDYQKYNWDKKYTQGLSLSGQTAIQYYENLFNEIPKYNLYMNMAEQYERIFLQLVKLHKEENSEEGLFEAYDRFFDLWPDHVHFHYDYARELMAAHRYDKALQELDKHISLNQDQARPVQTKIELLLKMGEEEEARRAYETYRSHDYLYYDYASVEAKGQEVELPIIVDNRFHVYAADISPEEAVSSDIWCLSFTRSEGIPFEVRRVTLVFGEGQMSFDSLESWSSYGLEEIGRNRYSATESDSAFCRQFDASKILQALEFEVEYSNEISSETVKLLYE